MSWERDPLQAKAKLFFQRAFEEPRDSTVFGLWCSLGLELLARTAISSISPTLLAEPDADHKHLLHALNRGAGTSRKSIAVSHVFTLCRTLFKQFTEDDLKASLALTNRRNDELHSGAAAFEEYKPTQWLTGFYRACAALAAAISEPLETFFGEDEAKIAQGVIGDNQNDVRQRVQSAIAAHKRVFVEKSKDEQDQARSKTEELGTRLSVQRHHRVQCPACQCTATVQGTPFGKEKVLHQDGEIVVRQAVSPTSFACTGCGLKFQSYSELDAAQLGGQFMRTSAFSAEEYYGLVDPDDLPSEIIDEIIERYREDRFGREYDNE